MYDASDQAESKMRSLRLEIAYVQPSTVRRERAEQSNPCKEDWIVKKRSLPRSFNEGKEQRQVAKSDVVRGEMDA